MLREVGADMAAYECRPCKHSGWKLHWNLVSRVHIAFDKLQLRFDAARRLRIIVTETGIHECATASGSPGLIERLEERLASADDLKIREQFLKYLSEP